MTAQKAVPVAIAVADMTAAEGFRRAVIELEIGAAMVGAIDAAAQAIHAAMVAVARRQLLGSLPVGAEKRGRQRRIVQLSGARRRSPDQAGRKRNRNTAPNP